MLCVALCLFVAFRVIRVALDVLLFVFCVALGLGSLVSLRGLFMLGYIDKCDKCSPSEVLPPAISVTVSGRMLKLGGYNK